jgi:hypothetical protein
VATRPSGWAFGLPFFCDAELIPLGGNCSSPLGYCSSRVNRNTLNGARRGLIVALHVALRGCTPTSRIL